MEAVLLRLRTGGTGMMGGLHSAHTGELISCEKKEDGLKRGRVHGDGESVSWEKKSRRPQEDTSTRRGR